MKRLSQRSLIIIILLSLAALIIALLSQHVGGMRPCAWCVFQRLILLVIILIALFGVLSGKVWIWATGIANAVVTTLGLAGVLAAWYQYSVAAVQFSCEQTFADRFMTGTGLDAALPSLFGIYATCMDARVNLLGIEYALWALGLFVVITALGLAGVFNSFHAARLKKS